MIIGRSSTKFLFFYADRKFKMAATAGHRLTLDPMGKCSNAFFSETTNIIKAKLYMNVHWMVLYKLYVFCSDMKFKMAVTAGLSLTLDPMGEMFQNASSLKPLGQLKSNFPGMIIGRSSINFMFFQMPSSQRNYKWLLKPNCTWMFIGWSSTNFTFFVPIVKFKMAATAGALVETLDPIGKNVSKRFFSETTNIIKAKLYMNVHWIGPLQTLQFVEFRSNEHSKWRLRQDLALTLDPMGEMLSKRFFSENH